MQQRMYTLSMDGLCTACSERVHRIAFEKATHKLSAFLFQKRISK